MPGTSKFAPTARRARGNVYSSSREARSFFAVSIAFIIVSAGSMFRRSCAREQKNTWDTCSSGSEAEAPIGQSEYLLQCPTMRIAATSWRGVFLQGGKRSVGQKMGVRRSFASCVR